MIQHLDTRRYTIIDTAAQIGWIKRRENNWNKQA